MHFHLCGKIINHKSLKNLLTILLILFNSRAQGQADNEIQVYASPTVSQRTTIFELHSNYTFKGSKYLADPSVAKNLNETLEITHGFGKYFEIGFYTFTTIDHKGNFQYLGNQIRPRVTVPESWKWSLGASLSVEFGFFRTDDTTRFEWQGEIRPILDKTIKNWYFSFNPTLEFVLTGPANGIGRAPQFKTVYTCGKKIGIGLEYYGALGSFKKILPGYLQEHLLGPVIDLYIHPLWEINGGFLFGLTKNSNQQVIKILLGRRTGK